MPFNGSNTFSIVNTFVPGTTILSSAVNANFTDIATGLSDCVTRDAQGAVTGNLLFSSTGYMQLPSGTTSQRPVTAQAAYFRFNSTTSAPEYYDGTAWDSLGASIAVPQGYLTLTNLASGGPITSSDQLSVSSVYYSPYKGQLCPVYNGTAFVNQVFSEQTLTLVAQHLGSTIYDVFAFLNSGVFTIATGPGWSNSAAGSGSRGTGAGTTQLQRLNGILTNQVSITARNGATTYTVAANQGTYLGSLLMDSTAGQISCHVNYGQSRKWGVWNTYNRVPIQLKAGDPNNTWSYTTNTLRAANGSTSNSLQIFAGLAEEVFDLQYANNQTSGVLGAGSTYQPLVAVGFNSTTNAAGRTAFYRGDTDAGNTSNLTFNSTLIAESLGPPLLGLNTITALESGGGSTAVSWKGTETNMVLSAKWRG